MRSTIFGVVFFAATLSTVLGLEAFTLEDFLQGSFVDKKWNGTWYDDKTILYQTDNGYELFDVTTKKSKIFLTKDALHTFPSHSITLSSDKKYVLVKYNAKPVYRHSTLANYAVLEVSHDGSANEVLFPGDFKGEKLQTCRFTSKGNALIYVMSNNIYYIRQLDSSPPNLKPVPVTQDGVEHIVYNGVPDWIYEEEVIAGDTALWLSPFGNQFIYAKFDDSNVEKFTYPTYGEPGEFEDQYPKLHTIRYPKVGRKNPKFSLHLFDPLKRNPKITSQNDDPLPLKFGDGLDSTDYVVYDVVWWNNEKVLVTYTNREQNERYLSCCYLNYDMCMPTDLSGWLDVKPVHILDDMRHVESYVVNGFDALRLCQAITVERSFHLGNMTVTTIYGHTDRVLYFEGTEASQHARQHVYSINLDIEGSLKCITCEFMVFNESCSHASAVFSPDMTYMTRICSGPGPTYVDIFHLKDSLEKPVVWLDNSELRDLLKDKQMPSVMDLLYDIPHTDMQVAVRLLLPPDISKKRGIKYPMLVNVYAGPNSNQIVDTYNIGLEHYLVTNRSYIYAFIDGRGSGKRGRKLMHSVYKKLGQYEIDDQIEITKILRDEFDFIHPEKIGIWGWSYGGFATAHVTARDNGIFNCSVSVAPVTDYIYYDSIYTERYMGLYIEANKAAYEKTDVTKMASNFKDKNFLLVHGNADDNVHYQQSMQLARALERADVQFLQMSYPDEAHALSGVKPHLYHMLDAFFHEHLGEASDGNSRLPPQVSLVVMLVPILWAVIF